MILASASTASVIILDASVTSNSDKSLPPVILKSTPRAPSIEASKSGLLIAASAAARAPPSPLAVPIPIKADPASDMIVFASAKSALISPGTPIRSEIHCTP